MTALAPASHARGASPAASLARPVAAGAALGAVVVARWAASRLALVDPVTLGALFGLLLLAIAALAGWRPRRVTSPGQAAAAASLGVAAGAILAMLSLVGPHPVSPASYAAGFPLLPWAAATALVAGAEEVVLRGALLDQLSRPLGVTAAVILTSALFAVMHVPVYGWQAAPLDLGVGLVLAGLRLVTGGIAAPAIAHVVADLAVVWL
jgi:membrane protease YdiL (CAAX protease family)